MNDINKIIDTTEYDEFSGRKGYPIRLLDLEDYYNSLPEGFKSGTPDKDIPTSSSNELTCVCPYCASVDRLKDSEYHNRRYYKQKLYIKSDFSQGWCHRCNTAYFTNSLEIRFRIPTLMKEYGAPSVSDLNFDMKDPTYNLSLYNKLSDNIPDEWEDKLYNRNPYALDLYKKLGFKYVPTSYSHPGILIPFYWRDELLFYQIWQFPKVPKYWNPPISNKPLYICGDLKDDAILVEGVFDAVACLTLYPDKTPIAVLGCTVSYAQLLQLKALFLDSIAIRMDDSLKSYKVFNRIKDELSFTNVTVIESDGTDPEEYLRKLIKKRFG